MADMMVSSDRPPSSAVAFPTITVDADQKVIGAHGSGYVVGSVSKLQVVPGKLAISCSGKSDVCLKIISNITLSNREGVNGTRKLDEEVRSLIEYEDINSTGVVCVYTHKDGFGVYHLNGAEHSFGQPSLKVVAVGSGADEFLELLENISIFKTLQTYRDKNVAISEAMLHTAERAFLNLVESLRAREYWTGKPSPNLYGGWFEMAMGKNLNGKPSLFRADQYAIFHVTVDVRTNPRTVRLDPCFFLHFYQNEHLMVVPCPFDSDKEVSPDDNYEIRVDEKMPLVSIAGEQVAENIRLVPEDVEVECMAATIFYKIIRSEDTFSTDWAHVMCRDGTFVRLNKDGFSFSLPSVVFRHATRMA